MQLLSRQSFAGPRVLVALLPIPLYVVALVLLQQTRNIAQVVFPATVKQSTNLVGHDLRGSNRSYDKAPEVDTSDTTLKRSGILRNYASRLAADGGPLRLHVVMLGHSHRAVHVHRRDSFTRTLETDTSVVLF